MPKRTPTHVWKTGWPPDVEWVRMGGAMLPARFWMTATNSDDSPDLRIDLRVRDGRVECSAIAVRAHDDGREVVPLDVRRAAFEGLMDRAVLDAARGIQTADAKTDPSQWPRSRMTADGSEDAALLDDLRRGRSRRSSPEKKRLVAEIYERHEKATDAVEEIRRVLTVGVRQAWNLIKSAAEETDPATGQPYLSEWKRKKETD